MSLANNNGVRDGFEKKVLSEKIKDQILQDLLSKKYKAGDRLIESSIAKEFNVSQAPVREAIKGLVEMGLLESVPYKGITVKTLSKEDLWEVFTVRATLESVTAGIAASKITKQEIRELEDILDKMIKAAKKGDAYKRTTYNILFHETIIRISGHKLIQRISRNMLFASLSYATGTHIASDSLEIAERHKPIIEALRNGDSTQAASLMEKHIKHTAESMIDSLE